jgi:hypothetical protein
MDKNLCIAYDGYLDHTGDKVAAENYNLSPGQGG